MPLPSPLVGITFRATIRAPGNSTPLAGATATLIATTGAQAPAANLTFVPEPLPEVAAGDGSVEWDDVLATDSPGLSNPVPYSLTVVSAGGRVVFSAVLELLSSLAVGGVLRLDDIAPATPGPVVVSYVLSASVSAPGGVAPLDGDGQVPAEYLPVGGGNVPATRLVATTNGLQGGGDLIIDRTLSPVYGSAAGTVCQGNDSRLSDARTPVAHGHAQSDVTGLVTDLAGKVDKSLVDAAGDLLVGTADNTLARLAAGGDGMLLTADSSQSRGLAYTTPVVDPYPISLFGAWHSVSCNPDAARASSGFAPWIVRVRVAAGQPITKLGIVVTSAGTVGAGGNNSFAAYSDSGATKLGETTNDNNLFAATGLRVGTMVSTVAPISTERIIRIRINNQGYSVNPSIAFAQPIDSAIVNGTDPLTRRSAFTSSVSSWPASFDPDTLGTPTNYIPYVLVG